MALTKVKGAVLEPLTVTDNVTFGDNNKAQFGAANDLEIFHNATDSVINDAGTGSLKLQNTGSTKLEVTTTGIDVTGNVVSDGADLDGAVVINESGADVDFRVESATNDHALFVQGSDGHVGIGTVPSSSYALHVSDADGILVESTSTVGIHKFVRGTGATTDSRPVIDIDADSQFDAVDGFGPTLRFTISDTAVDDSELGAIGFVRDGSDTQGKFVVGQDSQQLGSVGATQFSVGNAETVVNDQGVDTDFRVESDTNTHALFVQGSDGRVGINTSTPLSPLEIGVASGASGSTSAFRITTADGGGWGVHPASAVANPVWVTGCNSGEIQAWEIAGVEKMRLANGLQLGSPTGGDKGAGTLNATAVYDDNTLLTDFVLDQAVDGEIDFDFYDSLELGGKAAREWDSRNLDIDHYEAQWRERKALPSFRSKAERFDSEGKEIRDSVGTLIQGLQQELETAMVHIAQLNARIKQLEEK